MKLLEEQDIPHEGGVHMVHRCRKVHVPAGGELGEGLLRAIVPQLQAKREADPGRGDQRRTEQKETHHLNRGKIDRVMKRNHSHRTSEERRRTKEQRRGEGGVGERTWGTRNERVLPTTQDCITGNNFALPLASSQKWLVEAPDGPFEVGRVLPPSWIHRHIFANEVYALHQTLLQLCDLRPDVLQRAHVIMDVDSQAAQGAFNRGLSRSRELHELLIQLFDLQAQNASFCYL